MKLFQSTIVALLLALNSGMASAAFFEDEEARQAILDLRQKVETIRQSTETLRQSTETLRQSTEAIRSSVDADRQKALTEKQSAALKAELEVLRAAEDLSLFRRSLLDLQAQLETLRSEIASVKGQNEQLSKELADTQRRQKDLVQSVDERIRPLEPFKTTLDGKEFMAEPAEKKDFDYALGIFRKGEFEVSANLFQEFIRQYPRSGFSSAALFWLGNAQYANRDYKEAMQKFRALIAREANHVRAPESLLAIANCQVELKDVRGARKTLEELIKTYPQSEVAVTAKERLSKLK
jgi:tol-pal system protein YbgF